MRQLGRLFIILCAACSLAAAAAEIYLADAIKKPAYARALTTLLRGSGDLPEWTKQVVKPRGDYVGTPVTTATIDGTRYELFQACQPHACGDNQLEVMFAPTGAQAWAALVVDGKPIVWLGAPSLEQQKALKDAFR